MLVLESWGQSLWTAEAEELRGAFTVRSSAMSTAIKPATNALHGYPWPVLDLGTRSTSPRLASTALNILCRDKGL